MVAVTPALGLVVVGGRWFGYLPYSSGNYSMEFVALNFSRNFCAIFACYMTILAFLLL